MTPIHTVSVSYVTWLVTEESLSTVKDFLTVGLIVMCNPPVMVCWFADIPMVDLAARSMAERVHLVLLPLQTFGIAPCRLILPNNQTAPDQM